MAKQNISARLDEELIQGLKKLADSTGKNFTDLVSEAIAQYLNMDVDTVGERLERIEAKLGRVEALEAALADLQGKLMGLARPSNSSQVRVLQPSQLKQ